MILSARAGKPRNQCQVMPYSYGCAVMCGWTDAHRNRKEENWEPTGWSESLLSPSVSQPPSNRQSLMGN